MPHGGSIRKYPGDPAIVDIPTSAGDPSEITLGSITVGSKTLVPVEIHFTNIDANMHYCWAAAGTATSGEGNANIAADTLRGEIDSGSAGFLPCWWRGEAGDSFYFRATAASTETDGLSYQIVYAREEDT